jgi:ssDNA thymidine ADP-ribosyltransferase, DarT
MNSHEFRSRFLNRHFYHFTDTRNLPSIRALGLLRLAELKRRGIVVPAPGGNEWSQEADVRRGLDEYVHLCFFDEHPMEYRARGARHIDKTVFLRVAPDILEIPGVLFSPGVANKNGVVPVTLDEAVAQMDFEAMHERLDWRDAAVKERIKTTRKYELLVPADIETRFLSGL